MTRVVRVALATCVVLALVGCGKSETPTKQRPKSTATIVVLAPKAGEAITGKMLTVRLRLSGGKIVNVVSQDLTPNEGHVHVSIDGKLISQTFSLTEKVKMPKAGSHLLQAEFVAKDHGPFIPRVLSTVTFTVKK